MGAERYKTVRGETRHEGQRIKGSRFLVTVVAVEGEDDVVRLVQRMHREISPATHHAYAYRLGPAGDRYRCHDDGEPGGSAGRPVLQQLEARGLTDTAVVVSRIFGGTKLGFGGLVRAYGGAAAAALDRAPVREVLLTAGATLTVPYDRLGRVQALLAARELIPREAVYGDRVVLRVDVPRGDAAEFRRQVLDCSAGQVALDWADES